MKTPALAAALLAVLSLFPARADAQQLTLKLQDGLVTLDAQNVSVRQILAEWARVGGARIVNGEKVAGGPVTLQLNGVPERQALDIILRGVSGYMLASRQASGAGLSGFDRIMIMPTSSAPVRTAAQTNAPFSARPTFTPPSPESVEAPAIVEDQDEPEAGDPDVAGEEEEAPVVNPQPGLNRRFQQRPPFPNPMGVQAQPFMPQGGAFPGQPQPVDPDEEMPAQPPTNPLNVPPGASSVPGVISPVPQQDPQQPNSRPRRPPL